MRRLLAAAVAGAAFLATATVASGGHGLELADHFTPGGAETIPGTTAMSGGQGASWKFVATIPTGNPHTDIDYFTQGGEVYASVGTLATGGNDAGQTIIKLTHNGNVVEDPDPLIPDPLNPKRPHFVSGHGSADCISRPDQALGLQHDVEATPKGNAILNTAWPFSVRGDAQLLIDATDNPGRCHDNGAAFGFVGVPQGGLELIDITDIETPVEIGLTSHIGEAHTVNVDPKRPHIAYAVTSDNVTVDQATGRRQNEVRGSGEELDLDGFEVVDMSSCMNFPPGTTLQQKRDRCRPKVYRYRYPTAAMALGHTVKSGSNAIFGCHELEVYPDDRLTCGSGNAAMVFDMSGAFDRNGKPKGTPLPCRVRPTTSTVTSTAAMITDCVDGKDGNNDGKPDRLDIPGWQEIGSPSLEGVRFLGAAYHMGRGGPRDATQDVDFDHELEFSASRRLIIATDERGGGVTPPGATCATGANDVLKQGNGGLHAYRVDRLLQTSPNGPAAADVSYAEKPGGGKAIFRAEPLTGLEATICTAHVFHQIPGQNRIFMGWYSQGTRVVDFVEHPNGTVEFKEAGFFIPSAANEWVSAVFKVRKNSDNTYTYWGATGDFLITHGRNAVDIYKVTLPAPPKPFGQGGDDGDCPSNDDADSDGLIDARESLLLTLLGNPDSDLDGIVDGNDDANGNGLDDEDEDDFDECPDRDSDGDGEDDEDEDD
jgi:hypothetical protein